MIYYVKQWIIASVGYVGFLMFGYSGSWSNPVIEKLTQNPNLFGNPLSSTELSWLVSIIYLGCILGTILAGPLANSIGQHKTLLIGAVANLLSFSCLAFIKNVNALIFIRMVCGTVVSNIIVANLVYLGEIASTEIRGMILTCTGIFLSLGSFLVFAIGHYVSYEVFHYVGIAFSVIYLIGVFYLPESPVFLLRKGRENEAKNVLLSLNRKEDAENISVMKSEAENSSEKVKWSQLLTVKCNRKALVITCVLFICQQSSGIGPMAAYTITIFEKSGSSIPPHIATMITGGTQLLSSCITPWFIERHGRRFLLLSSTFLVCVSMTLMSIYLNLDAFGYPIVQKIKWLPLAAVILYFLSYGFGFSIIPSTLVGEMFQLNLRSVGSSVALFASFSAGFITLHTFGFLISGVGIHVAFILFSVICAVAFVFTLVFVPETKGKSLIEVQKMLSE